MSARAAILYDDEITLNGVRIPQLVNYDVEYKRNGCTLNICVIEDFNDETYRDIVYNYVMRTEGVRFIHTQRDEVVNDITGLALSLRQVYGVERIITLDLEIDVITRVDGRHHYENKELRRESRATGGQNVRAFM